MTSAANLTVEKRTETGTRASRRLRAQHLIPGIIFGHKQEPVPVTVKQEDIESILKSHDKVVDLQLDGKTETAVITELQWDTFGANINHVDFQRVDPNERMQVEVNIVLKGMAQGVLDGGTLEHHLRALPVECPAISIPHEITHRISDLKIDDELKVGDLELPDKVTSLEDDSTLVAQIILPPVQDLEGEGEESTEAGEPALVGEGEENAEKSED